MPCICEAEKKKSGLGKDGVHEDIYKRPAF